MHLIKVRFNLLVKFYFRKTGFNMIKEGLIGLAFKLIDGFFLVIQMIFGVVVVRIVI